MKLSLNLASRSYVNQRALKKTYQAVLVLLIGLLVWQLLSVWQLSQNIDLVQANLKQLQGQLEKGAVERLSPEQIKAQEQEHQQAQALLRRDAFRWTGLFDRLENLLPDGASIRSLNPDYQQRTLVLSGVVRALPDLQALLDNLHDDSFKQVFLQSQSQTEVNDGQGGKRSALLFSIKLEGMF